MWRLREKAEKRLLRPSPLFAAHRGGDGVARRLLVALAHAFDLHITSTG